MHEGSVAVFAGGGTGGHLYPALALADELVRQRPGIRPYFLGARRGLEARVLPERQLEHRLLPVRGLGRGQVLSNLGVPWSLVRSVAIAFGLLRRLRPELVVVTGGYAGAPAGLAAALSGIPLVLQEQNAWPGATTRLLSRWAAQVHLAFPEAVPHFPSRAQDAIHLSGCPIRPLPDQPPERRAMCDHFGLDPELKILLVVGGSQGSVALNDLVQAAVLTMTGDGFGIDGWQLLWATGPGNHAGVEEALSAMAGPARVRAVPYIEDIPSALSITDLALSRAGAMTTAELLAWGVPAILVPLPTAAANHQAVNAQALYESGAAVHLPQGDLTAEVLWRTVVDLASDEDRLEHMGQAARTRSRPTATEAIVTEMIRLLPGPRGRVPA